MSQRLERVEELLRNELSLILQREVRDPRVQLATVSRMSVSRDLAHAEVWVSVLGDDPEQREGAIEALTRAQGFIRSQLARRVKIRAVPHLVFKLDRGAEHSQKITELLENLNHEHGGTD